MTSGGHKRHVVAYYRAMVTPKLPKVASDYIILKKSGVNFADSRQRLNLCPHFSLHPHATKSLPYTPGTKAFWLVRSVNSLGLKSNPWVDWTVRHAAAID